MFRLVTNLEASSLDRPLNHIVQTAPPSSPTRPRLVAQWLPCNTRVYKWPHSSRCQRQSPPPLSIRSTSKYGRTANHHLTDCPPFWSTALRRPNASVPTFIKIPFGESILRINNYRSWSIQFSKNFSQNARRISRSNRIESSNFPALFKHPRYFDASKLKIYHLSVKINLPVNFT